MLKTGIILSLALLLVYNRNNAQTIISKIAFSIADTSKSELEQANEIYNWITSNIRYDVRSFVNHSPKNYTPEKTLKVKKGLCSEYAGLMAAMCNALGIEAYSIHGYSKGFGYYPDQVFTRSNHSWNVIRADSNWIIVDPTWGTGYLDYKPKLISNLLNKIFKLHSTANKIIFYKKQSSDFFNIPSNKFIITHYPLCPQWLFENHPPSYISFESNFTDSSDITIDNINDIEDLRNKSPEYFWLVEGESGLKNNPNNHFDIALAYLNSIQNFNGEKLITPENVNQFESVNEICFKIIKALDKQQLTIDSLHNFRILYLKQLNSYHTKANKIITKEALSAKSNFSKNKKNNSIKEISLYKKISAIEKRIALLKETHINKSNKNTATSDPDQERTIRLKLADLELEQPHFEIRMDSLQNALNNYITIDAQFNDSLSVIYELLNRRFSLLSNTILTNQEQKINIQSDSLWNLLSQSSFLLERKKANITLIDSTVQLFSDNKNQWEKLLKEEQSFLKNAYKTFNYPDAIFDVYENTLKDNISMYQYQISFDEKLITHTGLQKGFTKQNLQLLKMLKRNSAKEYRFFTNWYNSVLVWEKGNYINDKKKIVAIKKEAVSKNKIITKNLNQYKINQDGRKQ